MHTLSTYQFEIEHRAGKKHSNADGLSRAEHIPENPQQATLTDEQEEIFEINQISKWNQGEFKAAQEADIDLAPVLKAIKDKSKPSEAKLKEMSCLLYTSPSPRDKRQSRMPSSA